MKWTAVTVHVAIALSTTSQTCRAFSTPWNSLQQQRQRVAAPRTRTIGTPTTPLKVAYDAIDAEEIDYFYEDEDPDDPAEMAISEIKMELDLMQIDYGDCFDRPELEQRLREAREDPSKFQIASKKTWQPQDGPIGMKSVETSFEGLQQNVFKPSKSQSFFGNVEGSVEARSPSSSPPPRSSSSSSSSASNDQNRGPPRWTQDAVLVQDQNQQQHSGSSSSSSGSGGGGGQSLHGYLEGLGEKQQHQQQQGGGGSFHPETHRSTTRPDTTPPRQQQQSRESSSRRNTSTTNKKGGWDPSQMSAEQIKAELDTFGVDYSDCLDRMDLLERWENARQGKPKTSTSTSFSSSSQQPKPKPQGRDAVRLEDRFAKNGDRFSSSQIEKPTTTTPRNKTNRHRKPNAFDSTNDTPRWTQMDGVQVEAASGGRDEIHFETDSAYSIYNRELHLEKQTPSEELRSSRRTPGPDGGASMWDGIRVEPAGTTHTDDPFRSTRKQRPSRRHETTHNEQGPGATSKNEIRLEQPKEDPFGAKRRKYYGIANESEKEKYTGRRDFRNDQQAKSTTIFKGIQVEEVPPPDDIKVSSYNREEQGGGIHYYKDFRADPQRADHHALYKGIQVECAPNEELPTNAVPTSRTPPGQQQTARGGVVGGGSSQTTSFQGYSSGSSSSGSKSIQEQLYDKQNHNPAGNTPDDPFAQPTLEHPHPEIPRRTTQNDVRVNTGGIYEGQWEKTVGGSSSKDGGNDDTTGGGGGVPGNMNIDGRL